MSEKWTSYGNMYATPPVFPVCGRCGRARPSMEAHDLWHEEYGDDAEFGPAN